MKLRNILFTFFVLIALSCCTEQAHTDSKISDPLEALTAFGFYSYETPIDLDELYIAALDGTSISNKDFIGKITLLNFWASWCPPCRSEMPSIERLYQSMKGVQFQIVAVNVGENGTKVKDFLRKNNYTFPVYLDETKTLSNVFASRGIPITYLINKKGKIAAVRPGAMEYDQAALIQLFKELVDG